MQCEEADVAFWIAREHVGTDTTETKRFEAIRATANQLKMHRSHSTNPARVQVVQLSNLHSTLARKKSPGLSQGEWIKQSCTV
jgi:hypothetical protein